MNKISSALEEAILEAAEKAGGEQNIVGYLRVQVLANPASFLSLLGKVLPMTIADTAQNGETRFVVKTHFVWPKDKDGNIVYPSWWEDERYGRLAFGSNASDRCTNRTCGEEAELESKPPVSH